MTLEQELDKYPAFLRKQEQDGLITEQEKLRAYEEIDRRGISWEENHGAHQTKDGEWEV